MALDDIFGLGKILPIDKLIDVLSKSVGKISKPYFDRKDIDNKAYEIKKLAEAHAEEMKIISSAVKENFHMTGGIEYKEEKIAICSPKDFPAAIQSENQTISNINERANDRLSFQETKKQLNIENVTAYAAEELKDEPPITDEPLDEDWTTRFFNIVEDISNDEMQALWGKILAGEIKQPKSYSLRTLELIRNLSKNEADTFIRVANFAFKSNNNNYLYKGKDTDKNSKYFSYTDISLLIEIGLIQPGDFVNYQLLQQPNDIQTIITAGNIALFVKIKANTPTIKIPVYVFSNSGNQLLTLINQNPPFDYVTKLSNSIKNSNVDVKYAFILSRTETQISHTQPLQDFY